MSFSRVLQLDAVLLNKEVDKFFADDAVRVFRNFTGARFDVDSEVSALTKTILNTIHVIKFGVTPGALLFGLLCGERNIAATSNWLKARIIGCIVAFSVMSYLKSRNLLPRITKIADVFATLNFVAFLANGIYPTFSDRLFDLRMYSQTGPGDISALSGHHRELVFHLIMEIFDNLNRVNLSFVWHSVPRKWLSTMLLRWFSDNEQANQANDSSKYLCVVCKQFPINVTRGGRIALDDQLSFNSSTESVFCNCYYCHACFQSQVAMDMSSYWDSQQCNRCGKAFPLKK